MTDINRYRTLHSCLDELVAKFLVKTGKSPSETTVTELLQWTYRQRKKQEIENELSQVNTNSKNYPKVDS